MQSDLCWMGRQEKKTAANYMYKKSALQVAWFI
jgi:hypothetical protein